MYVFNYLYLSILKSGWEADEDQVCPNLDGKFEIWNTYEKQQRSGMQEYMQEWHV